MASIIVSIARAAQLTFSKGVLDESFAENFGRLKELINQVTVKDLNLSPEVLLRKTTGQRSYFGRSAPVTYLDVYEDELFSIGIFIIHPGCRIPLHDHPGMQGIIKVLHGRLNIRSFTVLGKDFPLRAPKSVRNSQGLVACTRETDSTVSPQDGLCLLGPHEGNLHEIVSVEGPAAFLDVLAPPYRDERDCHYYECVAESISELSSGLKGKINWFRSIPSRPDFWCDSVKYTGPTITLH